MSSPSNPNQPGSTLLRFLWAIVNRLTEPDDSVQEIEQRYQARLLASLLIVFILLALPSIIIQLITVPGFQRIFPVLLFGVIVFIIAYVFSRTKYHNVGAVIAIAVPSIAVLANVIIDPDNTSTVFYLTISVLLSSVLLSWKWTFSLVMSITVIVTALPFFIPALTIDKLAPSMGFTVLLSGLILVFVRYRNALENSRQTELALSENRWRMLVNQSPFSTVIYSIDGHPRLFNQAAVDLWNLSSLDLEDFINNYNILEDKQLETKGVLDTIRQSMMGLAVTTPPMQYEFQRTNASGSPETDNRWLVTHCYPVKDEAGKVTEIVLVHEDISERKKEEMEKERLLKETQRRAAELSTLLEAANIVSSTLELDQLLFRLAQEIANALDVDGCTLSHWDKTSDSVITWIEYRQSETDSFDPPGTSYSLKDYPSTRHVLETGQPISFVITDPDADPAEVALMKAKGETSILILPIIRGKETLGLAELDESTRERRFTPDEIRLCQALVNQAAIAIKNVELIQATHEQAQQLELILKSVQEGIVLLDEKHQVLLANPVGQLHLILLAKATVGDKFTHIGGRPLASFLDSPPDRGSWHEVVISNPRRTFEIGVTPLKSRAHNEGWVLILRNVTEERERQEYQQAQERLATVGQLAAGIAHDFNNIIAVVTLYADLVSRTPDISPENRERMETIQKQASRAANLIGQVLDFSRKSIIARSSFEIVPFLRELLKLMERTLPENISIDLSYDHEKYVVNFDPTRLQQVLINLGLNARDAMPEGGNLSIRLDQLKINPDQRRPLPDMLPGDWLKMSVSDTGTGIKAEHLPHVFEPFFTTKSPDQGTGLGLSQAYGIIKQHEGYIDVSSQEGQGATFTIYLPVLMLEETSPVDMNMFAGSLAKGSGEAILVVEDNAITREAVTDTLSLLGYQVLEATNGQEALKIYEQQAEEISLVISDLVMPDMGGEMLFKTLRQKDDQIKMVMMSGYPLKDGGKALLEQGVVAWIPKPFSTDTIANVIQKVLNL